MGICRPSLRTRHRRLTCGAVMCKNRNMRNKSTQSAKSEQKENIAKSGVWVNTRNIARVLERSDRNIRQMFERGQLRGVKIGARWRMHARDFAALRKQYEEGVQ